MGNWLTPAGKKTLKYSQSKKKSLAFNLLHGDNITKYIGGMCFDAAAYIRFLENSKLKPDFLSTKEINKERFDTFQFTYGQIWDGQSLILPGKAIGFYRLPTGIFFHVAIAIGGHYIRGVNGHDLGIAWSQKINLKTVLKEANPDGTFNYMNARTRVYISPV